MSSIKLHTLLSLATALLASTLACAQPSITYTVPKPSPQAIQSHEQQISFTVQKSAAQVKGVQVYLDPPANKPLTPNSDSFLGSVFFSDEESNNPSAQATFVISLKHPIQDASRLVLAPIAPSTTAPKQISVLDARITAVDNSAFR